MTTSPFTAFTVPAGTMWFICCGLDWGPHPEHGFPNPGPARFSPIHAAGPDSAPASVVYAGDTWRCALGETVFRDQIGGTSVHPNRLNRGMLQASTTGPVTLADLRATAARATAGVLPAAFHDEWGGPPGTWYAAHYATSQHLGQTVYDDKAAPTPSGRWDGIAWNSHQDPAENAYLLFTDRAATLSAETPVEPLSIAWRDQVGEYASSLRVVLPISW